MQNVAFAQTQLKDKPVTPASRTEKKARLIAQTANRHDLGEMIVRTLLLIQQEFGVSSDELVEMPVARYKMYVSFLNEQERNNEEKIRNAKIKVG